MKRKLDEPKSPSEITAEWLNDVLFPEIASNKIISIEIDEKLKFRSGLGKAMRVKLNYATQKCEPDSVIVKFQVNNSDKKIEGEIYQLLEEAKASFMPSLYGVFGEGNLVLEDLSPTHFNLPEANFTIAQARNVISLLADVNSRFWGDSRVPKIDQSHFINSININYGECWDNFKNRYQKQLGKEVADFEWIWKNAEVVSRHYNSGQITLIHGDVNNGNLLFPNNGSNKPILIDWQLSGQKVLPFDLSYFIVKNLSVEQRREHEDALVKEYYELLPDHIKTSYSFDRLMLDYRACLTRSMLSAVTRMGPKFDHMPNRFKESDKLVTRVIEAARDLKPVEAIHELQVRGLLTCSSGNC
jgi:hypothetical protein